MARRQTCQQWSRDHRWSSVNLASFDTDPDSTFGAMPGVTATVPACPNREAPNIGGETVASLRNGTVTFSVG
jgi:hypothetical protein